MSYVSFRQVNLSPEQESHECFFCLENFEHIDRRNPALVHEEGGEQHPIHKRCLQQVFRPYSHPARNAPIETLRHASCPSCNQKTALVQGVFVKCSRENLLAMLGHYATNGNQEMVWNIIQRYDDDASFEMKCDYFEQVVWDGVKGNQAGLVQNILNDPRLRAFINEVEDENTSGIEDDESYSTSYEFLQNGRILDRLRSLRDLAIVCADLYEKPELSQLLREQGPLNPGYQNTVETTVNRFLGNPI